MNLTQFKCLAVFAVFALIGFGPVSPGCLIGMFIVAKRPDWFLGVAGKLYAGRVAPESVGVPLSPQLCRTARIKCFASLLALFSVDIAPVPVTPAVAFMVILARPIWFYRVVEKVYGRWPPA